MGITPCTFSKIRMYKNNFQMSFEDFFLPFEGHLSESNRWIRLSKIIPWKSFEKTYCKQFKSKQGNPAKSARMALGCLIIKERLRCSDEETVQQIIENPYLQCFLGFKSYQTKPPLEASTLVHFRKRISPEMIASINEQVIATIQEAESNLLTSPSVTKRKGRNSLRIMRTLVQIPSLPKQKIQRVKKVL